MNEILLEFAGRMADAGATRLPESYAQLVTNAQFYLKTREASSPIKARDAEINSFRLNPKKGRMTLGFEDGSEQSVDAQVVGTYSDDGSWMWAWGHPDVAQNMQTAAWAVQQFGERQEIEELLTRGGPTNTDQRANYHAICAYISNADGVFSSSHGGGGEVSVCYYVNDQLKELEL